MEKNLYVQYGCGLCAPKEWLNFDASIRVRLERIPGLRTLLQGTVGTLFPPNVRYGDIVHGLPVADGSARAVYCSHILEHLARDEVPLALNNTRRLLKKGGIFRLIVPDLKWRILHYIRLSENLEVGAADKLIESCHIGTREIAGGILHLLRSIYGRSQHIWMYDFLALEELLKEAGFVSIRRCDFGDAGDEMFSLVEDVSRFFDQGDRELAIEAINPRS